MTGGIVVQHLAERALMLTLSWGNLAWLVAGGLLVGLALVLTGGAMHLGVFGDYGGIFVAIGLTFGLLGLVGNRHAPYIDDPWYEVACSRDLVLGLFGLGFLTRNRAHQHPDDNV
jgi:hypothetical protein